MDADATSDVSAVEPDFKLQPIMKLAVVQFILYSVSLGAATIGWCLVVCGNQALLVMLFGQYLADHIIRWTGQVPLWGIFTAVAALLGLTAASGLKRARVLGVALGAASYIVGFVIDLTVARALFSHAAAGLLVGWILFSPIVFGRDCLFRRREQKRVPTNTLTG